MRGKAKRLHHTSSWKPMAQRGCWLAQAINRSRAFFFRQGKGCVEKSGKIEGKKKKCDRDKERSNEALSKLSPGDAALVSVSGA